MKKVSKAQKNDFSCFFVFCQFLITFFGKVRQPSSGISPSLKVIERQTKNGLWSESRSFRKWTQIGNRTDEAPLFFKDFTLKVPIYCILASGPFPLQPYYSRAENVKFYSTIHVNTFLMMTNDREERCHNKKASQSSKNYFYRFFNFFFNFLAFFWKSASTSFRDFT